jgi:SAM-dependent methyltransferase
MSDEPGTLEALAEPSYDEFYYQHYEGGSYERSPQWQTFFGGVADQIVQRLAPSSVLDAGCAIGLLVEALADRGVDAHGIDVSEWAIAQVPESLADRCTVGSLADPIERRFDLVVSIEVLEHIEETALQSALDNLCSVTDRLLISTTPAHYDDPTHINIKQPERWSAELARRGFVRDLGFDATFIAEWAALYTRTSKAWPQVIEDYDRQFWYDRREILSTRNGILALQDQLRSAQAELAGRSGTGVAGDDPHSVQVELLRLRDELRGALAEKGSAAGEAQRLREELAASRAATARAVESMDHAVAELVATRTSWTWRIGRLLMTPVRLVRGRR